MKLASTRAIVRALNESRVRFIVAGGLAVNAHGFLRFTKDIDLILQLDALNLRSAFGALSALGYRPMVPVTAEQFGDRELRSILIREKGMRVLQFWSDEHRETPVDVFVDEPFSFDEEYARAFVKELADAGPVHFVALATLIEMKEAAGREQDRIDVEHLRLLLEGS